MTKPREKTREKLTDTKAGARLPIVGTAPHSFLLFRGTLERHFLRFEYKVPSMPFFALWKPQKHRRFQPLTFHLLPLFYTLSLAFIWRSNMTIKASPQTT